MQSYNEVLACLFEAHTTKGRERQLEEVRAVSKSLGSPERNYASVHIAGTNGKGSVATKIAKALELSGLKVGLFTSPHLSSYQERISINCEWISKEEVVEGAKEVFLQMEAFGFRLNFFEMTTLLAFRFFSKNKVDVAVVETGLGGRLDATNIITPVLSVITSIGRDHISILGDTEDQIAYEKAGIIKPQVPVVIGPKADYSVIRERAKALLSPLVMVEQTSGFYDRENSEIAKSALSLLSALYPISDEAVCKGIESRPPCRFEEIGGAIVDVAHNEDGFKRLLEALEVHYPEKEFCFLLGMSKDKEVVKCLELVSKKARHIYLVQSEHERSVQPSELASVLLKSGYTSFSEEEGIGSGVKRALEEGSCKKEVLVIAGSFFIMAEAREALGIKVARDFAVL
jgi:dihydrofolate synthase / folylpolyglutamate synthase